MAGGVEGEERGGGEAGGGGEALGDERGDGPATEFGAGGRGGAGEIGGTNAGSGVLDFWRQREPDGKQCGAGLGFGGRPGGANEKLRAAGDGLRGGHAGFDAGGAGAGAGGEDDGFLAGAGKKRGGAAGGVRFVAEHGVKREIGDVEDGEHRFGFGFWVLGWLAWNPEPKTQN